MKTGEKLRVLLIDDAPGRRLLRSALAFEPDMKVIGVAAEARVAQGMIAGFHPDVVILNLDAPKLDTLALLERITTHPAQPVIAVTARDRNTGIIDAARRKGALETITLPRESREEGRFTRVLIAALRRCGSRSAATTANASFAAPSASVSRIVIAVGASTGGTHALAELLSALPRGIPGVVIVQHMPKNFTAAFARRLDSLSPLDVSESSDGEAIQAGTALLAPGDRHMLVERWGFGYRACLNDAPPVHHQRPAVDPLFESTARAAGPAAIGVLLTGLGSDGARGLLAIRERGGRTIVQDERTSLIFGMPKEAIRIGAAERVLPLPLIAPAIVALCDENVRRKSASA